MDLKIINQAVFDTMEQVAPGARFILVTWGANGRAAVSSNVLSEDIVIGMLKESAKIVATENGHNIELDEIAGTA